MVLREKRKSPARMMQRVAPGARLGAYTLVKEIGRGGSAVVYLASGASSTDPVAIKIVSAGFAADRSFHARFRQEVQLISRLRHPNILGVLDSGESDGGSASGVAYLVTAYLGGGSLGERLPLRGTTSHRVALALAVAAEIGEALDYAHASGVLHRDIKPSNILISAAGSHVLADFGLARVLQSNASLHLTASGLVAGTPAYMAPEQALGQPADSRTDLYGLAVVVYELITGRVPFQAEGPLATMMAQVHQPPPDPAEAVPDLPPGVVAVLLRALAKEPATRFQSGHELAGALRRAVVDAYGESAIQTGAFPALDEVAPAWAPRPVSSGRHAAAVTSRPVLPWRRRPPRRTPAAAVARSLVAMAALLAVAVMVAVGGRAVMLGPGRLALADVAERFIMDSSLPHVQESLPRNNAKRQPVRPSITVGFSHQMNTEAVQDAVKLDPAVPIYLDWDGRLLVITPTEDLRPGAEYSLLISETARDVDGRPLTKPFVLRFSTEPLAEPPSRGAPVAAPAAPTPNELVSARATPTRTPDRPRATATRAPAPNPTATIYTPPTIPPLGLDESRVAGLLEEAATPTAVLAEQAPGDRSASPATPSRTVTPATEGAGGSSGSLSGGAPTATLGSSLPALATPTPTPIIRRPETATSTAVQQASVTRTATPVRAAAAPSVTMIPALNPSGVATATAMASGGGTGTATSSPSTPETAPKGVPFGTPAAGATGTPGVGTANGGGATPTPTPATASQ